MVLLPAATVEAVKEGLAETEEGPRSATEIAQVLNGLQTEWEQHWPIVHRQLVKDGALTPAQTVAAAMGEDKSAARNQLLRDTNILITDEKP